MTDPLDRSREIDLAAYAAELRSQTRDGGCFVCDVVRDGTGRHIVFEDEVAIAFLPRHLTMPGRVLLAPKAHRTEVVDDFTEDEYADLQRRVHRLGRAVSQAFDTERLYVFSFGAREGAAHVHWHIAALPPGVPYLRQQFHAVMIENGHLSVSDADLRNIAQRIRDALTSPLPD